MSRVLPFSGAEPGAERQPPPHPQYGEATRVYTYADAHGVPVFYVCRYEWEEKGERRKDFRQGHYKPDGKWAWNLRGVHRVLYRLPELAAHLQAGSPAPIYVCEGEKDAEAVVAALARENEQGVATTLPMGAGKWRPEYTETLTGARHVVVVADMDEAGQAHARAVAAELRTVCEHVELLRGAGQESKSDVSDHLAAGGGLSDLIPLELPASSEGALLLDAYEFIRLQVEPPEPWWGTPELTIVPQGGLVLFAGRPGAGKTTWVVDLACHLASGMAYIPRSEDRGPEPWPVPRPLRVALIENEGPLELFREKLRRKLAVYPHKIPTGHLLIQAWRWGAFSFADNDAFARAEAEFDALGIDVVIGDPLTMLGVRGVGSPEDTREFVQRLRLLGLGTRRAYILIHHFRERVDKQDDELSRISGAWGGHLDTLITLSAMGSADQVRLALPKLRWATVEPPKPLVLGKVYRMHSFEAIGEEGDSEVLEPLLAQTLAELREAREGYGPDGGWYTHTNLANRISRNKQAVRKTLEGAPHLFASRTGPLAQEMKAKKTSVLWGLVEWPDAPKGDAPEAQEEEQATLDASAGQYSDDDIPW